MQTRVCVVDGARTPFLKFRGEPGSFRAADLAVYAGRALLARQSFDPSLFDEVILGCVGAGADEANIARLVSLRLGCGYKVPAWTVQRNCASGLQAIDCAFRAIQSGQSHLVLAGGTEAMSHAPLLVRESAVRWLSKLQKSKSAMAKLKALLKFRPEFLSPEISLMKGLTDPFVGMSMGQTAEEVAYQFQITKTEMDSFAQNSHAKALYAQEAGYFKQEIVPIFGSDGPLFDQDDGIRNDATLERLAKLRPVFDQSGNITAGNSSQVTDGAALLILASEKMVEKYDLPVLGMISDTQWSGVDPRLMGLGPVHAIHRLLERYRLNLSDIAAMELNEAFSAQVLGCLKAWNDPSYCSRELGLASAWGSFDRERLNIDGGAIALGHPVGASGARIVLHLLHLLNRVQGSHFGVASLCIGGGQGGAMLVQSV